MDVASGRVGDQMNGPERRVWRAFVDGGWALMARLNAEFSAEGLSLTDLRVLEVMADMPDRSISEVAGSAHMGVSTVSRLITRLIDAGDVARTASTSDARHRLVSLTEQGHRTLDRHVELRDRLIRKFVIEVLTDDEYAMLGETFTRIGRATR
ncbi:hypothetical protein GCM10009624_28180 [Gordonia sinesedis]